MTLNVRLFSSLDMDAKGISYPFENAWMLSVLVVVEKYIWIKTDSSHPFW
jgi:hypothetical protein